MKKLITLTGLCLPCVTQVRAQWTVYDPAVHTQTILNGLGIDPANVQDQYNALLVVKRDAGADRSWWDILGDLNGFTVELLISGLLWLIGHFASLMVFWAYMFQKFILFTGYALSPLLIGMMAIPPLRSIGSRYLMHLVGVLLWLLGWAVAAAVTATTGIPMVTAGAAGMAAVLRSASPVASRPSTPRA